MPRTPRQGSVALNVDGDHSQSSSNGLSGQGHRLLKVGIALLLLPSFAGFALPNFTVPNLGRSVHSLSAFSGVLLLTLGLLWPRLNLGTTSSRIAFWFLIYSDFAIVAAFLMAGVWGAGNTIIVHIPRLPAHYGA